MSNYKIDFVQTANNNKVRLSVSFQTKTKANQCIKNLAKAGRIEKRGYEYFTTNRNLELCCNY